MRTVESDRGQDAERMGQQRESGCGLSWKALAKAAAAVLVGRAAQRVLNRDTRLTRTPEQGRHGGEVSAAPVPRRVARPAVQRTVREAVAPKGDEHAAKAAPAPPSGALATAKTVFAEFGKDNGTLMAAAVAFYILIALAPLVLVGIGIFGYFMSDPDAQSKVLDFTARFMPGRSGILQDMVISAKEARETLAGVGLIGLLITALGGFTALENAINITWGTPNRHFVMSKLFALGMFVLIGALLVLSIGISSAVTWARGRPGVSWLGDSWVAAALGFLAPVLISSAMFTFIYKCFPNRKVDWKPALTSGFITAVLWDAFKMGYQWYGSSKLGNQEATYGVAAGFVGLILWIYYSSSLVLLGSELTWVLQGCPSGDGKAEPRKER